MSKASSFSPPRNTGSRPEISGILMAAICERLTHRNREQLDGVRGQLAEMKGILLLGKTPHAAVSGLHPSDKGSSESGAAPATYALPGWFLKSTTSPLGETTNLRLAGIANGPGTFLRRIVWE